VQLTQQQLEVEMNFILGEGRGLAPRGPVPLERKNQKNQRERDPCQRDQGPKSLHGEICTGLDFYAV